MFLLNVDLFWGLFKPKTNFINVDLYVKKKISPEKLDQIRLLGDKSFIEENKIIRVYPNKRLFSHILGQIDDNNNGVSGVEKSYDYELTTSSKPLSLTLDTEIQYLIREELIKSKQNFSTQ